MTARLDLQRLPSRLHRRVNSRKYRRGYRTLPHAVWGDNFGPVGSAGAISLASVTPASFAATTGAKVLVLRGTGFVAPASVNIGGTLFTGGAVVINSTSQITVTIPDGSTFVPQVGTSQPVMVQMTAGNSNTRNVAITATVVGVDAPLLPGDPGAYVISVIEAWVDEHPDLADEVLSAEEGRPSPRVTLVDWLQGFISHRDDGTLP